MSSKDFVRVKAIHPHWTGTLSLSKTGNIVRHDGHSSTGTFIIRGSILAVQWDRYPAETFQRMGSVYVHETMLDRLPRLQQLHLVSLDGRFFDVKTISITIPELSYDVTLRPGTSDVPTFQQIFISREYDSPALPDDARAILDLGANIGLSAVFFGTRYPNARIVAVEPDSDNYSLLLKNVTRLGDRVSAVNAAVWSTDGTIALECEDPAGDTLDAWALRVSEKPEGKSKPTKCYNIASLIDSFKFPQIDILKVDIEGAELEVFSRNSRDWLSRAGMILVETHDRFRPGSESAVRTALGKEFIELPRVGENLIFRHS